MTDPVIPEEAVEAAVQSVFPRSAHVDNFKRRVWEPIVRDILEAALPILLSHEREQTRLAHMDAIVNRETKADELRAEYRRGYRDGLVDRKQVTAEPREWEPGDPLE